MQEKTVTSSAVAEAKFPFCGVDWCFPTLIYFTPGIMLEWDFSFSRSWWGLESTFLINSKVDWGIPALLGSNY